MDERIGCSENDEIEEKENLIYSQIDPMIRPGRKLPLFRTTQASYLELACSWS
jgi:hypothetical protein